MTNRYYQKHKKTPKESIWKILNLSEEQNQKLVEYKAKYYIRNNK